MPTTTDASIYQQLRQAIDQGDEAAIQTIFDAHPALNWNAITQNGLSALWFALTPPKGQPVNTSIVRKLLNLRRGDGQYMINPDQMYAGLRADYYVRYFSPTGIAINELTRLINAAQSHQQHTLPDAPENVLVGDAHGASHPMVLRASDASLRRLYERYAEQHDGKQCDVDGMLQAIQAFLKTTQFKEAFPQRAREQDPIEAALERITSNTDQRMGMDAAEGPTTLKEALALVWTATQEKDLDPEISFHRKRAILTALLDAQTAYGYGNHPSCWAGTWGRIGTALCGLHDEVYYVKSTTTDEKVVYLEGEQAQQKYSALIANELSALYTKDRTCYWAVLRVLCLDAEDATWSQRESDHAQYKAWIETILPRVWQGLEDTPVASETIRQLTQDVSTAVPTALNRSCEQLTLLQNLFHGVQQAPHFEACLMQFQNDDINEVLASLKKAFLHHMKVPDTLSQDEAQHIDSLKEAVLEAHLIRRDEDNNPLPLKDLWPALRIETKIASLPDPAYTAWYQALPWDQQQAFNTQFKETINTITEEAIIDFALQNHCLSGLSLKGHNLEGKDLRGLDLRDVDFSSANLRGANLGLMQAEGAKWAQCDLTDAVFNQWLYPEALLGSVHCTEALLREKNRYDNNVLQDAMDHNRPEIVTAILESQHCKEALLCEKDRNGRNVLQNAIYYDRQEIVTAILQSEYCTKALLCGKDSDGKNALQYAVILKSEIVTAILQSEHCTAALLSEEDHNHNNALKEAIVRNQREIASAIVQSKYCTEALLCGRDRYGENVLQYAINRNRPEIAAKIVQSEHCKSPALYHKQIEYFISSVLPILLQNKTRAELLDFFQLLKDPEGPYYYLHELRDATFDHFRLSSRWRPHPQPEQSFLHTATFQQAMEQLKNTYNRLEQDTTALSRQTEEQALIGYTMGNLPNKNS